MVRFGMQSILRLSLILLLLGLTAAQAWCVLNAVSDDLSPAERMFVAVSAGDANEVRDLLRQGVSPVARDSSRMTPLMCAAGSGRLEIAQLLIASGSPLDSTDRYGMTPLLHAVRADNIDMVTLLLGSCEHQDRMESEKAAVAFADRCGSCEVASFLRAKLRAEFNVMPASFTPAGPAGRHRAAL